MDMDNEEDHYPHGQMSHEEILQRFKKLFAREMTAAERRTFFLDPLHEEGKG
jgi:hypothetical protein